jgi:hypothetical protein
MIGELILLPYREHVHNTKTILATKKLGVQTKRPKILVCYDFHAGILDE